MKMSLFRILIPLLTIGGALLALFAMPSLSPVSAALSLATPSIVLALLMIAAVIAVLAAAYHPSLFSWRMSTGTPFDDGMSFMAKGSGGKDKGKGMGRGKGGGKKC